MLILFDKLADYAADSLPLNQLAKELYMSKYSLIRKCKKNLRYSYTVNKRVFEERTSI